MFNPYKKILFIHIPKTGGRAVSEFFGVTDYPHLTYSQAESFYNLESKEKKPFTFAFIRNPHDRFVSCFKQLVSKPKKRTFKNFKNFTPSDFQSWVKLVWFPHYNEKPIKINDPKMQEWVLSEMCLSSPHGFEPNIYNTWLKNNSNNFNSIDALLDFQYPLAEMKRIIEKLNNKNKAMRQKQTDKINKSNLKSYSHFWDSESLNMFNSFAKKDIEFYKDFLNIRT